MLPPSDASFKSGLKHPVVSGAWRTKHWRSSVPDVGRPHPLSTVSETEPKKFLLLLAVLECEGTTVFPSYNLLMLYSIVNAKSMTHTMT